MTTQARVPRVRDERTTSGRVARTIPLAGALMAVATFGAAGCDVETGDAPEESGSVELEACGRPIIEEHHWHTFVEGGVVQGEPVQFFFSRATEKSDGFEGEFNARIARVDANPIRKEDTRRRYGRYELGPKACPRHTLRLLFNNGDTWTFKYDYRSVNTFYIERHLSEIDSHFGGSLYLRGAYDFGQ